MKTVITKNIYLILTVIFLVLSLFAGVYLVRTSQETRRGATCTPGGGGCGDSNCCRSWEVYQGGCCHSTAGCTKDSDCSDGKKCNNGVCEGSSWSPQCGGSENQCDCSKQNSKECRGSQQYVCGNDCCWHYDSTKDDGSCQNKPPVCNLSCDSGFTCQLLNNVPTCVTNSKISSTPAANPCKDVADSGCTTGGKGGVDCANCRQTGGQVKQCSSVWYCCYSDGNCYQGTAQKDILCQGSTITNNSGKTVSGNVYRGCSNGNKIGSFTLADKQSKSASDCTQIDVPGYCGVCNSSNCQPSQLNSSPTQKPAATATTIPTKVPTKTPPSTPSPTGTIKPTTPTNTPTPSSTTTPPPTATSIPSSSPTPSPTSAPNSTPAPTVTFTPPSYLSPTPPTLPVAGVNLPLKALTIFGSIVTLLGFLVLL